MFSIKLYKDIYSLNFKMWPTNAVFLNFILVQKAVQCDLIYPIDEKTIRNIKRFDSLQRKQFGQRVFFVYMDFYKILHWVFTS